MDTLSEDDLTELGLLRALEVDELVSAGLLSEDQRFDDSLLSTLHFTYPEMNLQICTGPSYPAEQLSFGVENLSLPRLSFDALRTKLRKIAADDAATNNCEKWITREEGDIFEFEMTSLHLVQKTVDVLESIRSPEPKSEASVANYLYKNDTIQHSRIDFKNATLDALAPDVLDKTPEQICEDIPECYRILHVESIIRNDSYSAFLKCQSRIRERIQNNSSIEELRKIARHGRLRKHGRQRGERAELIDHLVTPRLTFHGTTNHLIPSIVRYGFLRDGDLNPETGTFLRARCGSTYGRGVYSSPSAEFSLMYSGEDARPTKPNGFWGLKLLVCATIMGVPREMFRKDRYWTQNEAYPGADSHIANRDQEYIVFDCAQILPVYVIHLDWGEDNRKYFEDIPEDPEKWVARKHPKLRSKVLAPGDLQRQKEALIAKAAKYFPYGYGPATGTSFVVEEVGEVDDDEENYGEYQTDRLGGEGGGKIWEWDVRELRSDEKDEYTDALWGKRKKVKSSAIDEEE